MKKAACVVSAAGLFLATVGCQAPPASAPVAVVEAPPEPGPAAIGAADSWGWALYQADRSNTPAGARVGEIIYP